MIEYFSKTDLANRITTVVHLSTADARDIKVAANTSHINRMQFMVEKDNTLWWADFWTSYKNMRISGIDIFAYAKWSVYTYHTKFVRNQKKNGEDPEDFDSHMILRQIHVLLLIGYRIWIKLLNN